MRNRNELLMLSLLFYLVVVVNVDIVVGQVAPPANQTTTPSPPPPTTTTTRLRIAVPVKLGFTGFVKVDNSGSNGNQDFSGFSIDVFRTVANAVLPKPIAFDFIPFSTPDGTMNGSYDQMLQAVQSKDYDGAVGDITIRFYRREWVEFSLPYTDSGVAMLVPVSQPKSTNIAGISLVPLVKGLLIGALALFIVTPSIFFILDCYNRNRGQPPAAQDRPEERLRETLRAIRDTRMVMVLFFAVLLLLTTCYAASLASLLTEEQVHVPTKNLNQLLRNGDNVGYSRTSFILNYLSQKGFPENRLIPFDTEEDMQNLLSKGTKNGGVAAVIHETPYLQVFLAQHCGEFALVPNFNVNAAGFGFAFQQGSPWVQPVSDGILRLLDNGNLAKIQDKTVGSLVSCQGDSSGGGGGSDVINSGIVIAGIVCCSLVVIILYVVYIRIRCRNTRRGGVSA